MDPKSFRSSRAGRPIKALTGYVAFNPNRLPPEIEFGTELVAKLSEADRAVGHLRGIGVHIRNPYLLLRSFLTREAVLSSRIEGTQASVSDLFFFEAAPSEDTSPSDVREVANYVHALEFALSEARELPPSLRLIREMHRILLEGTRGAHLTPGAFRRTQNWIGAPGCILAEATFVPPPVGEMLEALDDCERYLHADDRTPPLVRLAILHYQFESIHPFLDGNGRIGRLLIALLLCEWKILETPLLYLSAFFERKRQDYYDALLKVSLEGKWEEWIAYFLEGVATQAKDAADRAHRLAALRESFVSSITSSRGSATLISLVDEIMSRPVITVPRAAEITGLSYQGAQLSIEKLVQMGILERAAPTRRPQPYVARDVLAMVDDELGDAVSPVSSLPSPV